MPRTYNLTVADVIERVRLLTQDKDVGYYRIEDAEIIDWLNDAIKTLLTLKPELFMVSGTHVCTAGSRQTVINNNAVNLVDVVGVLPADYMAMTAFQPAWQAATAGAIQNWLRIANEPLVFFTYPNQAAATALPILYVEAPTVLATNVDPIPLPETYIPALVHYCVSMIEMGDDEHTNTNRASQLMADFAGRITGGKA